MASDWAREIAESVQEIHGQYVELLEALRDVLPPEGLSDEEQD